MHLLHSRLSDKENQYTEAVHNKEQLEDYVTNLKSDILDLQNHITSYLQQISL